MHFKIVTTLKDPKVQDLEIQWCKREVISTVDKGLLLFQQELAGKIQLLKIYNLKQWLSKLVVNKFYEF